MQVHDDAYYAKKSPRRIARTHSTEVTVDYFSEEVGDSEKCFSFIKFVVDHELAEGEGTIVCVDFIINQALVDEKNKSHFILDTTAQAVRLGLSALGLEGALDIMTFKEGTGNSFRPGPSMEGLDLVQGDCAQRFLAVAMGIIPHDKIGPLTTEEYAALLAYTLQGLILIAVAEIGHIMPISPVFSSDARRRFSEDMHNVTSGSYIVYTGGRVIVINVKPPALTRVMGLFFGESGKLLLNKAEEEKTPLYDWMKDVTDRFGEYIHRVQLTQSYREQAYFGEMLNGEEEDSVKDAPDEVLSAEFLSDLINNTAFDSKFERMDQGTVADDLMQFLDESPFLTPYFAILRAWALSTHAKTSCSRAEFILGYVRCNAGDDVDAKIKEVSEGIVLPDFSNGIRALDDLIKSKHIRPATVAALVEYGQDYNFAEEINVESQYAGGMSEENFIGFVLNGIYEDKSSDEYRNMLAAIIACAVTASAIEDADDVSGLSHDDKFSVIPEVADAGLVNSQMVFNMANNISTQFITIKASSLRDQIKELFEGKNRLMLWVVLASMILSSVEDTEYHSRAECIIKHLILESNHISQTISELLGKQLIEDGELSELIDPVKFTCQIKFGDLSCYHGAVLACIAGILVSGYDVKDPDTFPEVDDLLPTMETVIAYVNYLNGPKSDLEAEWHTEWEDGDFERDFMLSPEVEEYIKEATGEKNNENE